MDSNSRNRVLMVGGALILIALLLVCGPFEGRFGGGEREGSGELPSVAAGPPEDASAAADLAAAGAAAGGAIGGALGDTGGQRGAAGADAGEAQDGLDAGAAGLAAGTAAPAIAAADSGGGGAVSAPSAAPSAATAGLPPVSAGVPAAVAGAALGDAGGTPSAAMTFDDVVTAAGLAASGVGPAGRPVDRFAPPVAGAAPLALAVASEPFGFDSSLLRPCDTPGSGCENLRSAGIPNNPPIRPGPPRPIPANPPILPGPPRPVPTP